MLVNKNWEQFFKGNSDRFLNFNVFHMALSSDRPCLVINYFNFYDIYDVSSLFRNFGGKCSITKLGIHIINKTECFTIRIACMAWKRGFKWYIDLFYCNIIFWDNWTILFAIQLLWCLQLFCSITVIPHNSEQLHILGQFRRKT